MQTQNTRDWWEQSTREAFQAAHARELERILIDGQTKTAARVVDAMVTAQWAQGFHKPRPLSGIAR